MAVSATLVYTIAPATATPIAALDGAVNAVPLPTSDMTQIGVTLASDTTAIVPPNVVRTIVFNLGPEFNVDFPPGTDQAAPFRDLYTHALGAGLASKVIASEPVVV